MQDTPLAGSRSPAQVAAPRGDDVVSWRPSTGGEPQPRAPAMATTSRCIEPAAKYDQRRDAHTSTDSVQPPPADPIRDSATWLFLPERRLEADPLRVRPADVRLARAEYQRMLLSGGPAALAEGQVPPASQVVSTPSLRQSQPPGRGQQDAFTASASARGHMNRGRLRRAMMAVSRTLRSHPA